MSWPIPCSNEGCSDGPAIARWRPLRTPSSTREAESAASAVAASGLAPPIAARLSTPAISRVADDAPKLTKAQKQTLKDADFEDMEGPPEGVTGIRRFRVLKPFPVPETKGPVKDLWEARAKGAAWKRSWISRANRRRCSSRSVPRPTR